MQTNGWNYYNDKENTCGEWDFYNNLPTPNNPQIYGIAGKKKHGKDTFAKFVKEANPKFQIVHFADPLKHFLSNTFKIDIKYFNDPDLKEKEICEISLDSCLNMMSDTLHLKLKPHYKIARSARELMQFIGTDYVRTEKDDFWICKLKEIIIGKENILIPDVRYINETNMIRDIGGNIIRMVRVDHNHEDSHLSETETNSIKEDIKIESSSGDLRYMRYLAYQIADGKFDEVQKYLSRIF